MLAVGAGITVCALAIVVSRPWSLYFWSPGPLALLWSALGAALAAEIAAFCVHWRGRRGPERGGELVRLSVGFVVAAAVPWFLWVQPFKALWLLLYAGVAAGAFALSWLLAPAAARALPQRLVRVLRIATFQVAATLLLAEGVLRMVAAVHPSPLLAVGPLPDQVLAHYRKAPGELHLGLPCDERGFNDVLVRRPDHRLVACIGDSFGFGLVPQPLHYTTVAERQLRDVELYNAAVIAAGPAEYRRVLIDDVLPLQVDAVLFALFVGNDVEDAERFAQRWSFLAGVFDREHLMLWVLPRRLLRVLPEWHAGRPIGAIQGDDAGTTPRDAVALRRLFPWLDDVTAEQPTMSLPTFLDVERRRAIRVCSTDADYDACFRALDALLATAGSVPVACLLIPDEFQVEDTLWRQLDLRGAERDRPQRLLTDWLQRRGVPCLDLLPAMRAVPPLADGNRHLYHLQDTHWNRRGNAVAGEALATFLQLTFGF